MSALYDIEYNSTSNFKHNVIIAPAVKYILPSFPNQMLSQIKTFGEMQPLLYQESLIMI